MNLKIWHLKIRQPPSQSLLLRLVLLPALLLSIDACAGKDWLEKGSELLNAVKEDRGANSKGSVTSNDISMAFKEALRLGSGAVTTKLGKVDGFNADPAIRIPLPSEFRKVKEVLGKLGMSEVVKDLEVKLNRAAEVATPQAKALFWQAIKDMTFRDVKQIYEGPDDAATRYFQNRMSASLKTRMQPIVNDSLSNVGAIKAYDEVTGAYQSLPLVPDVKADLTNHVVDRSISGIFHYIAKEEAAIRNNPAKQTTNLLKRVFGMTDT